MQNIANDVQELGQRLAALTTELAELSVEKESLVELVRRQKMALASVKDRREELRRQQERMHRDMEVMNKKRLALHAEASRDRAETARTLKDIQAMERDCELFSLETKQIRNEIALEEEAMKTFSAITAKGQRELLTQIRERDLFKKQAAASHKIAGNLQKRVQEFMEANAPFLTGLSVQMEDCTMPSPAGRPRPTQGAKPAKRPSSATGHRRGGEAAHTQRPASAASQRPTRPSSARGVRSDGGVGSTHTPRQAGTATISGHRPASAGRVRKGRSPSPAQPWSSATADEMYVPVHNPLEAGHGPARSPPSQAWVPPSDASHSAWAVCDAGGDDSGGERMEWSPPSSARAF